MDERILVAEDEPVLRENQCEFLRRAGYHVTGVADGEEALKLLLTRDFPVLITDIRMPKLDGIGLLKRVVRQCPQTSVLVTTAYASVETAVEALRHGAYDYLLKPVMIEDLLQKVKNLLSYNALKDEVTRLRRDLQQRLGFGGIIGESTQIRQIFGLIEKVAPTRSTVLVTGESGTGKELVARAIHDHSEVADKRFLAVNLVGVPEDLMQAQLFGHEKGAFTGATKARPGLLRNAQGGTVFLDEVGELAPTTQAKLLRALDQREILPLGSDQPQSVDFRLIAATNRNLEEQVKRGAFRADLFYRLNVFHVDLPPLRDRASDIPALVEHFLSLHSQSIGQISPGLTNDAIRALMAYPWPGNVRELSNVVERSLILAGEQPISPDVLPAEFRVHDPKPVSLRETVEHAERNHIAQVLDSVRGDRVAAAELLEVDRATLYRRLAKYGLGGTADSTE